MTVDAYGDVYVSSFDNAGPDGRIDIFDDEGRFISELPDSFGPKGVAVDSKGNLYVVEQKGGSSHETVRYTPTAYDPEAGEIEYDPLSRTVLASDASSFSAAIAIDPSNDHLYLVYEQNSIREYESAAHGSGLLTTITPSGLSATSSIAVDGQRRRLYVSSCRESGIFDCEVVVLDADSPHGLLGEVDGSGTPLGKFRSTKGWLAITVDEKSGDFFVGDLEESKNIYRFDEAFQFVDSLTNSAFQGGRQLQIAVSNSLLDEAAENRRDLFVPVPSPGDRVLAFALHESNPPEVSGPGATSIGEGGAELRAVVDPQGADTEYVIEFEIDGSGSSAIAARGIVPGSALARVVSAVVTGLAPGVTYRFRVHAESDDGEDEAEGRFTTYSDAPVATSCANAGLRTVASTLLPDCRAYELVSPPDTNGRPLFGVPTNGERFTTLQVSPSGATVSFVLTGGALPGSEGTGSFDGDPYRATRGDSGWTTAAAGPSGAESPGISPGSVSPDQGYSFWSTGLEGSFGRGNYVRYPDGHSEPIGVGSLGSDPNARGLLIAEDGRHILFRTEDTPPSTIAQQLEPDAPPTGTEAVYDRTLDGVTHVVSLLPGNVTPNAGEDAQYRGASADGEGIAFQIGSVLYLRKGNTVTYPVGEGVTFAGVSDGGRRVFFVKDGDILAFETATEEVVHFTDTGDATPIQVAPGGSRAYFVSPSILGGANPNGSVAEDGKQNLYLSEEGLISFVGTITARDVQGEIDSFGTPRDGLGLWTQALAARQLARDPSRITPDGSILLFQSRASLDGHDTGGLAQVFRYDSHSNRLHCLSCLPTGPSLNGAGSLQSSDNTEELPLGDFALVPNLRADGKRAFFQATGPLVSYDTDEVQDVYEWEEQGVGSCSRPGGCIYLISSGRSEGDNYLYGMSSSGDDVFIVTTDALTRRDAGATPSIYDARVDGGFDEAPALRCEGEGCRPSVSSPPELTAPGTPSSEVRRLPTKRCPKAKRRVKRHGKVRCVRRKPRIRHHRGNHQGGRQKGAGR